MNRSDLIAIISEKAEITKKQAESSLQAILESISLTVNHRATRKGRNPATGAEMVIPASAVPGFKPASSLKSLINENHNNDIAE